MLHQGNLETFTKRCGYTEYDLIAVITSHTNAQGTIHTIYEITFKERVDKTLSSVQSLKYDSLVYHLGDIQG